MRETPSAQALFGFQGSGFSAPFGFLGGPFGGFFGAALARAQTSRNRAIHVSTRIYLKLMQNAEPRLSVKERIEFFKKLGSKEEPPAPPMRNTVYPVRNIFDRGTRSPDELRSTEIVKSNKMEVEQKPVTRKSSRVGALTSLFQAKIQAVNDEKLRHADIIERRDRKKSESVRSGDSIKYDVQLHNRYDSSDSPMPSNPQSRKSSANTPSVFQRDTEFTFQEAPSPTYFDRNTFSESLDNKKRMDYFASLTNHPTVATRITEPFADLYKTEQSENQSFTQIEPRAGVMGPPEDIPALYESMTLGGQTETPGKPEDELGAVAFLKSKNLKLELALEDDSQTVIEEMLEKVMESEARKIIGQSQEFLRDEDKTIRRIINETLTMTMINEVVKQSFDSHMSDIRVSQAARKLGYELGDQFIDTFIKDIATSTLRDMKRQHEVYSQVVQELFIDTEIVQTAFQAYQSIKDAEYIKDFTSQLTQNCFNELVDGAIIEVARAELRNQNALFKFKRMETKKSFENAQTESANAFLKNFIKKEVKQLAGQIFEQENNEKSMELPRAILDDIIRKELRGVVKQGEQSMQNEKVAIFQVIDATFCLDFIENSVVECCENSLRKRDRQLVALRSVAQQIEAKVKKELLNEIIQQEREAEFAQFCIYQSVLESSIRKMMGKCATQAFAEVENAHNISEQFIASEISKLAFETLMEERKLQRESMRKKSSSSFFTAVDLNNKKRRSMPFSEAQEQEDEQLKWLTSLEMSHIQTTNLQGDDIFSMEDRLYLPLKIQDLQTVPNQDCNAEPDQEMKINTVKQFGDIKFLKNLQQFNSIPIDANFVDLLCVNCYECIKLKDVNKHSLKCQKPKNEQHEAANLDKCNLVEINDRIFKLIKSIDARLFDVHNQLKKMNIEQRMEYSKVLAELSSMGNQVFINNSYPIDLHLIASKLQTTILQLTLTRSFYFSTKVFAERLVQLLASKVEIVEHMCHGSSTDDVLQQTQKIGDPFLNELLIEQELKEMEQKYTSEQMNLANVQVLQNKMLNEFMKKNVHRRPHGISEVNSDVGGRGPLSALSVSTTAMESIKNFY